MLTMHDPPATMMTENDLCDRYPILCAWCEREGKRTVVGWSTVEGSHGICERHERELRGYDRQ